ncbi:uncharacterized protein LOC134241704 [Saccostrea cucullata]|uniref:uncharacterized protein LOC134241704 n=1 Tax=Saccostrea cuccullata TaxID=36930 RepID=UPI002ED44870
MSPSLLNCFTKEKGTLITEQITVKVIDVLPLEKYQKRNGESREMFRASVCDATYVCITNVYDSKKVTIIQPNKVLILEDFYIRNGEISITSKTNVFKAGDPPEIPDDIIDKASLLLRGLQFPYRGLLRGIADLHRYKCCINGRCRKRKLQENKCPKCGRLYTETSSEYAFVGKLSVETDSENNTYTIFTPQVEQLCTDLGCNIKSTSLEDDIVQKLSVNIKFKKNGEKITKISVETSVDVHGF